MRTIELSDRPETIQKYLIDKNWIENESILSIEKPGEGNMNVVLRIRTNKRSFILKQSRPFVQKYQQIPAPIDRIKTEHQFYNHVEKTSSKLNMPSILEFDPDDYLIMMEDIGDCNDMTSVYESRQIEKEHLSELLELLKLIHGCEKVDNFPSNITLRQLNHQHIFVLPYMANNGFNLDDIQVGLSQLAKKLTSHSSLKGRIEKLGDIYLSEKGSYLIHGDYYPGSWMQVQNKVFVLDPEFSFIGFKEFDLGVMAAHLTMATMKTDIIDELIISYQVAIDDSLVKQFAGAEIIRRLIGLAQLPLQRDLKEKEELLVSASALIMN